MSNAKRVLNRANGDKKANEPSIYDLLAKDDWIAVFGPDIDAGSVRIKDDGTYEAKRMMSFKMPWVFSHHEKMPIAGEVCYRYHQYYMKRMRIIPSPCFECYKVVVKPRTVVELYKLHEIQKKLGLPCKCGTEDRVYVPGRYSGYFYNAGLENGRKCKELVAQVVAKIDPAIPVILKRGCTEYELEFGPSDKWQLIPNQLHYEHEFEKRYSEVGNEAALQSADVVAHIKRAWIHYAASQRPPDMSYLELTNGRTPPGVQEYASYVEY